MSDSTSVKSVEALRRGLTVLHAIEQSSAATLTELHHQTGLPKATLMRILKTLEESGWISRRALERRYVPAAAPGETDALSTWRAKLSALAAPIRTALERRIPWPTDLAIRDGTTMLILDAHRPINGLAVNYRVLGFRPAMMVSSLGRCYLAFCPAEERRALLSELVRSTNELNRKAARNDLIERLVADGHVQGYCTRDSSELGSESPERFGAMAVPVFAADTLVACLSCAWLPRVTNEASIVLSCMPALREAANLLGERVLTAKLLPPK
jgi:IclR family transcriptional regulator, mhp operon transcriptional activator